MKKIAMLIALVACSFVMTGCDIEGYFVQKQIEEMCVDHLKSTPLVNDNCEIGKCSNYKIDEKKDGKQIGTLDVEVKDKSSAETAKITFKFVYNEESDEVVANIINISK